MLAYIQAAQIVFVVYAVTLGAVCVVIAGYRWLVARIAKQEAEERRIMRERQAWRLRTARHRMAVIDSMLEKRKAR